MYNNFEKEMNDIWWWHRIEIEDYVTPGKNAESQDTFDNLGLPEDMNNMTVLDIGAWDGFYSFACEKRGASVTASDKFVWQGMDLGNGHMPNDDGFNFAHKHLNSNVNKLMASVEELDPNTHGKFDIVLMLGVIYHATDPIGYLKKAKDMSNSLVFIETHVDLMDLEYPAARYYIGSELNNDNTNYWGPNALAVRGMMHDLGYRDVTEVRLRTGRMIFRGKVN
jgi:tRNA (mo5U34)-methyltransferase